MKFGVIGTSGTVGELLTMAEAAEEHGWDGFLTWDGISVGPMATWDPWTLLAAAAVRTERVGLGALVFALARRRPWKVAREALTVDHLSGGRLVLPVGLGAADDRAFAGVAGEAATARERAERLDEALDILTQAWSGEPFSYTGTHHTVSDMVIAPPPVQRPRIPVWVVGGWPSERSMSRAARWDGVVLQRLTVPGEPAGPLTPAEIADAVTWVGERRARAGVGGPYDVVVEGVLPDDPAAAVDHVGALAAAGVTWWIESRWDVGDPSVLLDRIRRGPPGA